MFAKLFWSCPELEEAAVTWHVAGQTIKKLKEGKAAGPDKVKAEIYHKMEKNKHVEKY